MKRRLAGISGLCGIPGISSITGRAAVLAVALLGAPWGQAAHASEQLAKAKACLACHQVKRKVVGPAYQDIAARYAGQEGMQDALAKKILNGSSGEWGAVPMPANRTVKPEEAQQLAEWILSLEKPKATQESTPAREKDGQKETPKEGQKEGQPQSPENSAAGPADAASSAKESQ